jgi:hypothetical protein
MASKLKNLTFKNDKREGQYRSFQAERCTIKRSGKLVGSIYMQTISGPAAIVFLVSKEPTKADPAPFRNVALPIILPTLGEAKEFVRKHQQTIQEKYNLHELEV